MSSADFASIEEASEAALADLRAARNGGDEPPDDIDWTSLLHSLLRLDPSRVSSHPTSLDLEVLLPALGPDPSATALPDPVIPDVDLRTVLGARQSNRNFARRSLALADVSAFLSGAAGVRGHQYAYDTPRWPMRRSPSGGALPSVDLYLVVHDVDGLDRGLYRYHPPGHGLRTLEIGDFRPRLADWCPMFPWLLDAGMVVVMVGVMPRQTWKYGRASYRLVHLDAGILVQSMYLMASALRWNCSACFGYDQDAMGRALVLEGPEEFVLLVFAVGAQKDKAP